MLTWKNNIIMQIMEIIKCMLTIMAVKLAGKTKFNFFNSLNYYM